MLLAQYSYREATYLGYCESERHARLWFVWVAGSSPYCKWVKYQREYLNITKFVPRTAIRLRLDMF